MYYCPDPPLDPPESNINPEVTHLLNRKESVKDEIFNTKEEIEELNYAIKYEDYEDEKEKKEMIRDLTNLKDKLEELEDEKFYIESELTEYGY